MSEEDIEFAIPAKQLAVLTEFAKRNNVPVQDLIRNWIDTMIKQVKEGSDKAKS